MSRPIIGSLCSGYGGLEMGLALALGGARTAWHVEYDKHPSAILAHRYPGVPNYGDVKTTDWTQVEPVDWLTAGYPCQPFSHAGLRKGADDPRHLWPDVARAIGVLRPRGVLLENVAGHVSMGLGDVLWDLASLGYVGRWGVVRAADAEAPHGRARIFIVAESADARGIGRNGQSRLSHQGWSSAQWGEAGDHASDGGGPSAPATDARVGQLPGPAIGEHGLCLAPEHGLLAPADAPSHGRGEGWPEPAGIIGGPDVQWGAYQPAIARWERVTGRPAPRPTEPGRSGERLSPRFVEWMMGLPDGWVTDVPGLPRNAQLKALGNGAVPQQAALACRLLGVTAEAVAA